MLASLVQMKTTSYASSSSSQTISYTSSVTAGNYLILFISSNSASNITFTVTDSLGQTWSLRGSYFGSPGLAQQVQFFVFKRTAGGACTVTFTPSSTALISALLLEYSGMGWGDAVNVNAAAGTSNAPNTGNIATLSQDLALAVFGWKNVTLTSVVTSPASFVGLNLQLNGTSNDGYYLAQNLNTGTSSTTTCTFTNNASTTWTAAIINFRPAGSGTPTLGAITASGTGGLKITGTGSATLKKIVTVGQLTLQPISVTSGVGNISIVESSGSATLHSVTMTAGVGNISVIESSGSATLHSVTMTAGVGNVSVISFGQYHQFTGQLGTPISQLSSFVLGDASYSIYGLTLGAITISGTGALNITGTGGLGHPLLQPISVTSGVGNISVVESSGSDSLHAITMTAGVGSISVVESSGNATLHALTITAGVGNVSVVESSGNAILHSITISGTGNSVYIGGTLQKVTITGTGRSGIVGTGPARVQHNSLESTTLPFTVVYTSPVIAGNFLLIGITLTGPDTPVVTDNLGNPWVEKASEVTSFFGGGTQGAYFFRVLANQSIGGSCTVTVSAASPLGTTKGAAGVVEYSGMGSWADIDQSSANATTSSTPTSTAVSSLVGDLVTAIVGWSGSTSTSISTFSPFTTFEQNLNGTTSEGFALADWIFATTTSSDAVWALSNFAQYASLIVSWSPFYAGPLGGHATLKRITASGFGGGAGHGTLIAKAITLSSSGLIINRSSSASSSLKQVTINGTGTHGSSGHGTPSFQAITMTAGVGAITITSSSASPKLSHVNANASGWIGGFRGNASFSRVTATATGGVSVIGTSSPHLSHVTLTGNGLVSIVSISASSTLPRVAAAGIGYSGSHGAATLHRITLTGNGNVTNVGSGSATLGRITAAGYSVHGFGNGTLHKIQLAGVGSITSRIGTGSPSLHKIVMFGTAYSPGGVGSATLPAIRISGSGVAAETFSFTNAESIVITETLSVVKYKPKNVSEHLTFIETLGLSHVIINRVSETFHITELPRTSGNVFNRNVSEHLNIVGGVERPLGIGNLSIHLPGLVYVLSRRKAFVSLSCGQTSIILPVPELGDIEAPQQKVVSKRSMNNILRTYTRRNALRKLRYTFVIGRPMALKLQAFLDTNIANVLDMQNWKDELWKVQITNNPVEFTGKSLFLNEGEKYEVELELQGIKLI